MGLQNRIKRRLFSSWFGFTSATVGQPEGRGPGLQILGCPFWPQRFALPLDTSHEGTPKVLEKQMNSLFGIFGRHFDCEHVQNIPTKGNEDNLIFLGRFRASGKHLEKCPGKIPVG